MAVTRKDVARAAGVSTATVSNVLNRSVNVKEETAQRVLEAVRRLEYSPNMVARSLSTKRTMQVAIVLEDIGNPFFAEVAADFERAAEEKNYFVNICMSLNKLDAYYENFKARGVDGVFVTALPHKYDVNKLYQLAEGGIKVVTSGNVEIDTRKICSIENDYENGIHKAMEYLYGLGHRRIAYLSGLGRELSSDCRCMAYLRELKALGLDYGERLLVDGKHPYTTSMRDGYRCAGQLLDSGKEFTAIICGNDMMAVGAMRALGERGLETPGDVSVIGIDGTSVGSYYRPSLTTLEVNPGIGRKAFELLYGNMMQGNVGYYKSDVKLVVRESTAQAPGRDSRGQAGGKV